MVSKELEYLNEKFEELDRDILTNNYLNLAILFGLVFFATCDPVVEITSIIIGLCCVAISIIQNNKSIKHNDKAEKLYEELSKDSS